MSSSYLPPPSSQNLTMNCCCFSVSSALAKAPAPPIKAGGKPPYLAGGGCLSYLLPARRTAFRSPLSHPLRTRAFLSDCLALLEVEPDVVIATATATARSPDPAVLLQTSVLLLSLYVVANFVVPSYVSKYLGLDEAGDEDSNPQDDDKRRNG